MNVGVWFIASLSLVPLSLNEPLRRTAMMLQLFCRDLELQGYSQAHTQCSAEDLVSSLHRLAVTRKHFRKRSHRSIIFLCFCKTTWVYFLPFAALFSPMQMWFIFQCWRRALNNIITSPIIYLATEIIFLVRSTAIAWALYRPQITSKLLFWTC